MWESVWEQTGEETDTEAVPMVKNLSLALILLLVAGAVLVPGCGATTGELIFTPIVFQKQLPVLNIERSTEAMIVVSVINITDDQQKNAEEDFNKKEHAIKTAKIPNATVKQNGFKKLSVSVNATPRSSGGITVEFFCKDNTGRFMPIWGGSITKAISEWEFKDTDIKRSDIEGCYFAVVDSTAEMGAL